MQINLNGMEMMQSMQEMTYMYQYCSEHKECKNCNIYNNEPSSIGNSVFYCENLGKGKCNEEKL